MAKLGRDKVALLLACASVVGGSKASAMNSEYKASSPRTTAAVRGATSQVRKGMPLAAKVIAGTLGTLGILELGRNIVGLTTSLKLGKYSAGRVIQNSLVDKKALLSKLGGFLGDFDSILTTLSSEEYKESINLDEFLSHIKVDMSKNQKVENEAEHKIKLLTSVIGICNLTLGPDAETKLKEKMERAKKDKLKAEKMKAEVNKNNDKNAIKEAEKKIKEAEEVIKGVSSFEVEYGWNSIIIKMSNDKFNITMNSDGSVTFDAQAEDAKDSFKVTLMPLKNGQKAV